MNERPPTSDTSHTISRSSFRIELDIARSSPRRALNRQGMRGHPLRRASAEARCADNKQCCRLSARETLRGEDTRIAAATRGRSTRAEVDGHARESTPSSGRDQGRTNPKNGGIPLPFSGLVSIQMIVQTVDCRSRPARAPIRARLASEKRRICHSGWARSAICVSIICRVAAR